MRRFRAVGAIAALATLYLPFAAAACDRCVLTRDCSLPDCEFYEICIGQYWTGYFYCEYNGPNCTHGPRCWRVEQSPANEVDLLAALSPAVSEAAPAVCSADRKLL